jgi:isoquinoline 1-oxidoreductase beta subunit
MFKEFQQFDPALFGSGTASGSLTGGSSYAPGRTVLTNVSRRGFLKGAGLVLAIQVVPAGVAHAMKPYLTGAEGMPNKTVSDPLVFIQLGADGTVTITAHRAEMGTGARTSVPMVLADEMEASWARVRIVQAPGDEPRYGNQDTDGSRSLRHFIQPMRQCGASMRHMLESAAAKRWSVDPGRVRAVNHAVELLDGTGPSARSTGRKLGYGELAKAAMAEPVPKFEQLRFKRRRNSATSARVKCRWSTCTTSPPAPPAMGRTCGCRE